MRVTARSVVRGALWLQAAISVVVGVVVFLLPSMPDLAGIVSAPDDSEGRSGLSRLVEATSCTSQL